MKKKAIKIAASTAVAASAFVAAAPVNKADAAVNVDQLVKDAENAAGALKWAISVEGTADGKTAPHGLYNLTKDANNAAKAAVAKTSGSEKVLYTARLQAVELQITRAMAYIDGITAGGKIAADTATLNAAIAAKDLDKVEDAYHQMTKEYRKQAALLDRVYGQSTRDIIRNANKKPAEAAIEAVKVDVTVKMHLDAADAATKAGNLKLAGESYAKAMDWMDKVSSTFKAELTKSGEDVLAALPLQPVSVTRVDDTTVTVYFNKAVDAVQVAHFDFDNDLAVTSVKLSDDKKSVTLTTTTQVAGKTYTLSYKDQKTSVAFTKPAAGVDNSVTVDNSTEVYLKADGSRVFTATFKNKAGDAYRGNVTVATGTEGDVKIVAVNGVNIAATNSTTVVPNEDGKVTVKIENTTTGNAADKVIFTKEDTATKLETGMTHFVVEADDNNSAGAKEVEVVHADTANNFFIGKVQVDDETVTNWYSYDSNDTLYDNATPINESGFEGILAKGNKVLVNYQNNAVNGKSDFNVIFKKTLTDLEISNPNRSTEATNPFRVAPNEQFNLAGKGNAGYKVYIYRFVAGSPGQYELHGSTTVNGSGSWSYSKINLDDATLDQFGVIQLPSADQAPSTLGANAVTDSTWVLEGSFNVASVTSSTAAEAIVIGKDIAISFSTFEGVKDNANFTNGNTLTFVDNQGVEATYTIGTATDSTKVKNVDNKTTNKTNKVVLTLGKPVYKDPSGRNLAFNHDGAVYLSKITGVKNQDNLNIVLPNLVKVSKGDVLTRP